MNIHQEIELENKKVERSPLTNVEQEPVKTKYLIMPLLHLILIWTNILVLFRAQLFFAGVLTDNPFLSTYLMTIIDVVAYLVTPFLNKILTRKNVFLLYFGLLTLVSVLGIFDGPKLMCFLLRLVSHHSVNQHLGCNFCFKSNGHVCPVWNNYTACQ